MLASLRNIVDVDFNVEIRIRSSSQALLVVCLNVEIEVRNSLQALLSFVGVVFQRRNTKPNRLQALTSWTGSQHCYYSVDITRV